MMRLRAGFTLLDLLISTIAVGLIIVILVRGLSRSAPPAPQESPRHPAQKSPEMLGLVPSAKMIG